MKIKQKKSLKSTLSDKIADALTVKPRADIEDDQVFGTKPHTVSRADFSSSGSEDDAAISDFRKRNVNLLSEISKKYEGQVVSQKKHKNGLSDTYQDSDSDENKLSVNDLALYDDVSDGDHSQPGTKPKQFTSDSEEDVDFSSQNLKSKASALKRSKRKVSPASEDFSSEDEGESDDYSIMKLRKQIQSDESSDEQNDEDDGDVENDEEGEGYDISQMMEPAKEEFEHVKKQNVSEEAKKGGCVRNQLLIWEGLLEMRIHLQRCMNTANQMPMPETYEKLKGNDLFEEECNVAKTNISNVLDKFLTLQNALLQKFPETKSLSSKKQAVEDQQTKEDSDEEIPSDTDNEEIPSDTEPEDDEKPERDNKKSPKKSIQTITLRKRKLEEYEKELATSHKAFKSFRDGTIQKWNDKTRLATATNMKSTPTNTILQQISYILNDRDKLVRRTQLKRSQYDIVGFNNPTADKKGHDQNDVEVNPVTKDRKDDDEYIPEIFDDSDFYHQLLRELIECKSADISDPVQLSRQWIALQQMRSKMKRKVDTKATKGRKIKYVVHNKLVNYMAPEKCTTWTDESANELYSSLFGKMFEQNNVGLNVNVENGFKIKD